MSIGIIVGTGADEMPEFLQGDSITVTTRFGNAGVIRGTLDATPVTIIARHGSGHSVAPSHINYRAQIAALKKLGTDRVVGICAVGALTDHIAPGCLAILSDFIDVTKHRADTFFDDPEGPVAHTDFTHPYCPELRGALVQACEDLQTQHINEAVYVGAEGPRYETPAEIALYRSWGGDVVGMTNVPEAVLAREAGLCYAAVAVVTNAAAGIGSSPLSHQEVRTTAFEARSAVVQVLRHAVADTPSVRACTCGNNTMLRL